MYIDDDDDDDEMMSVSTHSSSCRSAPGADLPSPKGWNQPFGLRGLCTVYIDHTVVYVHST